MIPIRSRRLAAACAAATFALAAPVVAEPFTLFIYEASEDLALRGQDGPEAGAYWGAYAAFAAEATEAGVLRGGSALHVDSAQAVTLRAAGAEPGPFAAGALALGGYFQIEAADRDAALAWAARLPAARSGAVEVRAGYPAPAM